MGRFNCDKCQDTGYIFYKKDGMPFAEVCKCSSMAEYNRKMSKSGIGEAFKNKTLDNYNADREELVEIKKQVMDFVGNYNKKEGERDCSLLILGSVGVGKTHLATAAANCLLRDNIQVTYFEYRSDITELKQLITSHDEYEKRMRRYQEVDCLLIDDLFKGNVTNSDIGIVYEIINRRYLRSKSIIVTSEKLPKELKSIDEAIASRIFEMSKSHIISIGNVENHRLK